MTAVANHQVDQLVARCYAGLDAGSLRQEVLSRLRRLVPIDAAFFAAVDPATLLFTSVLVEEPLRVASEVFLENEIDRTDVNHFTVIARSQDVVTTLDRATNGDRRSSSRYSEIMAPLGLGDELRAVLMSKGRCWGVMCLHRQDSPSGFTESEVKLIRGVVPHIGEGFRRALLRQPQPATKALGPGPGVVVLNEDLSVSSINPQAEHWLAELGAGQPRTKADLPFPVHAAARALLGAVGADAASSPTIRLRTTGGEWITVYASPMRSQDGMQASLVLEPARPLQVASLFLDAHGLTPAQHRVATLVLQGLSTRQIVNELRISSHTVQEHLGAVFEKFGIGSRRELVATLLGRSS